MHAVKTFDTLSTIARHYGCSTEDLISLNQSQGLNVFNLRMLDYVCVPGVPDEADLHIMDTLKRNEKVKRFMHESKCSGAAEAVSYLHMKDYDLTGALNLYKEDTTWEAHQRRHK